MTDTTAVPVTPEPGPLAEVAGTLYDAGPAKLPDGISVPNPTITVAGTTPDPEVVIPEPVPEPTKTSEELAAELAAKPSESPTALTPASYTFTTPDGFVVNEEAMGAFKTQLATAGVSPEAAQQLFDIYAAQQVASIKAVEAQQTTAWDTTQAQWKSAWDADPAIGGANRAKVETVIGKALDEFGDQAARDAFTLTGAGNNPAIAKMIYSMASALIEDGPVTPGNPPRSRQSPAASLYGPTPTQ